MLREEGTVEIRTERSAVGRRGNPKFLFYFQCSGKPLGVVGCGVIHLVYVLKDHCICGTEEIGGEQSGQLSCSRRHRIHLCAAEATADACALPRIIAFLPGLFSEPPSSKHLICVLA